MSSLALPKPTPSRPRARRRVIAVIGLALAGTAMSIAAAPAAAVAPSGVAGDHHSPQVVLYATDALARYDQYAASRSAPNFAAFAQARDEVALVTGMELGIDPLAMRNAWRSADVRHQVAVLAALTQLGVAYRSNSSDPGSGFDCSGLTAFAWGRAGVELARQSGSQISAASDRDHDTAVAGDLMQYPGHVMLYLGVGDAIVHASNWASDVELSFVRRSVRYGDPS